MESPRPDPEALVAHEAFLRRIARPLVRDEAGADDIVQETWLTALRKPPGDASRLRQWLGKVARNLALRSRRAEERRARREQAVARPEGDDVVSRVARHRRIVDAVMSLDEPYRTAVLLRFYDGLTSDEIGARSGVSGAAVRKRLKKALGLLRVRLDDIHGGDRRAWSAVLLPFVVAPRLKRTALLGGLVVGTKAKLGLAAVLVLVLFGAFWGLSRRTAMPARSEIVQAPGIGTDAAPAEPDLAEALPPPVDFSLIDRDRDVHGVVVRRDGTPVAGAVVAAVYFPWRRVLHMNHDRRFEERAGPHTRSATDGTFALRLEWGDLVHLRANAAGFAPSDMPLVQAGERVRLVLALPTRLAVIVRDPSGRPLPGAHVELTFVDSVDRGPGRELAVDRCRREGVTSGDGRLVWEDLLADGRASLHVSHRTHVSTQRWIDVAEQDEIDLTLEAGVVVRGRVLDAATMRPVAGALVGAIGPGKETRADAEGRYALAGMKPTVLHASADGYAQAGVQIHRDRLYRQYWPQRVVENAEEVDIHLVRAEALTGRVVGPAGAPVAGALLTIGSPAILSISAESGPDGRFRIEGPWSARAPSDPGRGDPAEAPVGDGWQHQLHVFAEGHGRTRVPFDGRKLDLGDIVLPPAGTVEGRVLTPEGVPIPGAPVLLSHGVMESRKTDDLGRFRFKDLEPGVYDLSTQPEGAPTLSKDIDLAPGGHVVADLRFESWRPFTVSVRSEDGSPVAGATVGVSTGFRSSRATTGEDGRATVSVMGTPRYASVEIPKLPGDLRFRQPPLIELDGHEESAEFVLVLEGTIRGRVEGPDGEPVTRARLEIRESGRAVRDAYGAEDGTFDIRVPLQGTFDLVLLGRMNPTPAQQSHILRGELTGIRAGATGLVLKARAVDASRTLRVRVLGPDGSPADAMVLAWPSARPFHVLTSAGFVELRGLPDEEVQVWASGAPHWSWLDPKPLHVIPAGQEVTLRFREAVTIAGRALLADGRPAVGASVRASREGSEIACASAGENGAFGFALEPGTVGPFRLEARFDNLTDREYSAVVDGVDPGASGVEIRLAAAR